MLQIRSKARALKERFPLEACSKEVKESAKAAKAAAQAKKLQRSFQRRQSWHDSPGDPFPAHFGYPRLGRQTSARPRLSKFHSANDAAGQLLDLARVQCTYLEAVDLGFKPQYRTNTDTLQLRCGVLAAFESFTPTESRQRRFRDRSERESLWSDRTPAGPYFQDVLHRNGSHAPPLQPTYSRPASLLHNQVQILSD